MTERTLEPLRELGGCLLEEEVGSGARGKVYRVSREGRILALKVFDPDVPVDRSVLERFLGNSPQRIRHPNLLAVESIGESGGRIYYTMQYLRGDSLRRILDDLRQGSSERPSLSPLAVGPAGDTHPAYVSHAARLIAEAAEGLEVAHGQGVFHRRLGPDNLIFSPTGRLVITDFGSREDAPDVRTAAYRSPEQLKGVSDGAPDDVYALGAILYELLTLRAPFAGTTLDEIRRSALRGRVVAPRTIRDDIPPSVEECILKALSRSSANRHGSAAAFAADLRRAVPGEPQAGSRRQGRFARWRNSPYFSAALRAAGAVALAALATLAVLNTRNPEPEPAADVLTFHDPGKSPSLAAALADRRPAVRRAALALLETSSRAGKGGDLDAVRPALLDSDPLVRRAAFRLYTRSGRSAPLLRALGIDGGTPPPCLEAEVFLLLHAALLDIADDGALSVLSSWRLENMERLDRSPGGTELSVGPFLRVRVPNAGGDRGPTGERRRARRDPGTFTRAWIDRAAKTDPELFLDALPRLLDREELLSEVLEALPVVGGARAITCAETIARQSYLSHGREALRALAALGGNDALLGLVESRLPLPFREAALASLLQAFPRGSVAPAERIALDHPDASLRALAFAHLARTVTAPGPPSSLLLRRALDDREHRALALSWLDSLKPGARSRVAVSLLGHRDDDVSSRAVEILSGDSDPSLIPPILAKSLHPSSRVRRAGLVTLRARGDLARLGNALSKRSAGLLQEFRSAAAVRLRAALTWTRSGPRKLAEHIKRRLAVRRSEGPRRAKP